MRRFVVLLALTACSDRLDRAPETRFQSAVAWLAADARQGRSVGSWGLEATARWLHAEFRAIGLEPVLPQGSYSQDFEVPTQILVGPGAEVRVDEEAVSRDAWRAAGASAPGKVSGRVVFAEHGATCPRDGIDDYSGIEATGRVVLVRRFGGGDVSCGGANNVRYQAWNARRHGAIGLMVSDLAGPGAAPGAAERPFPPTHVDPIGDAGIPIIYLGRSVANRLREGVHQVDIVLPLEVRRATIRNIIGKVSAAPDKRRLGAVLVAAHYDHLGLGHELSRAGARHVVHNGADDNASGTAAILEVARRIVATRDALQRDVYIAALTGEESGVLGAVQLVAHPPPGLKPGQVEAMLNLDMVGRIRSQRLQIISSESSPEWRAIVEPACARAQLTCTFEKKGYGSSDQAALFAAGVPVLHLCSGAHDDYHTPEDDVGQLNPTGAMAVVAVAVDLTMHLATRETRVRYRPLAAGRESGEPRVGGSLGLVPEYSRGQAEPRGVSVAAVRRGSAAETAGLRAGDVVVGFDDQEVRDAEELLFLLRASQPGQRVRLAIRRGPERSVLEVVLGSVVDEGLLMGIDELNRRRHGGEG